MSGSLRRRGEDSELVILEAMAMESPDMARSNGIVKEINGGNQLKAPDPVISLPRIKVWISWVPSYV